jgi:hypothetical protein
VINKLGSESGIPDLTDGVAIPVLQDNSDHVIEQYGAEKWYLYVIDKSGFPSKLHYKLDVPGEISRIETEVEAVR